MLRLLVLEYCGPPDTIEVVDEGVIIYWDAGAGRQSS
jgi:hypothetical protein